MIKIMTENLEVASELTVWLKGKGYTVFTYIKDNQVVLEGKK